MSALLADRRAAAAVQRQPDRPGRGPHTLTWETEDSSQEHAKLHRTTKIEADAWGEVGPAPPRIKSLFHNVGRV